MIPAERGPYSPEITKTNEIDLSGKVAVVTGSSRGIGREIALTLASHKANVVLNSTLNSLGKAEEVKSEIEKMGQKAIIVTGDVSKEQTALDIVANAASQLGPIDILVNNAGTRRDKLLMQMSLEEWQSVIDTNLTSAFLVSREVVKNMFRNKTKGSIISISSLVATLGNKGQVNYGASKAGLIGLTYSAAQEYESRGIRFNALALGLVNTELTGDLNEKQRGEIAQKSNIIPVKEVAEQVLYLASDKSIGETAKLIIMDGVKK